MGPAPKSDKASPPPKKKSTKAKNTTNKPKKPKVRKPKPLDAGEVQAKAAAARADMETTRQLQQAKAKDPLWFRMESIVDPSKVTSDTNEHISIVDACLKRAGLSRSQITPQAASLLLEESARYTRELMDHAADVANPESDTITKGDIALAYELFGAVHSTSSTATPKMHWVASSVNRAALPTIPRGVGMALPPQSLQRTYDLVTNVQTNGPPVTFPQAHQQHGKNKQRKSSNDNNKATTNSPGYGAVRGPNQIAVNLQTTTNSVAAATGAPK
jgi:Transcription initiation factor IID, 31kD subunit